MVGKTNNMKYFRNILLSPTCEKDILEREAASENQKCDYKVNSVDYKDILAPFGLLKLG